MKPNCPHCKKNDMVFASHMFGKKDMSCVRCKRTFRPTTKKKETATHRVLVFTRKEFKTITAHRVNQLLASGHNITVAK